VQSLKATIANVNVYIRSGDVTKISKRNSNDNEAADPHSLTEDAAHDRQSF
jgi:hypothetical protein